ncbi:putative cytosolic purine 5-nucleotidase [Schistosoma mansoni]|uniref:putative cytosolic purine 5-nucleotidase n=1 Tax=Schistosoma mansoni TaxID=6183 RepID=UPI00022DC351|nr:putative cytosolic purine 5-nucleotidase [Schistosoma mansoni]|eukprot:XP_018650583.1 putative cytosolic purine 5-nucleotidase [Schistosoma mansoni]
MNTSELSECESSPSIRVHKRETKHRMYHCYRIFVNRSLQLDKIKFFGFDMDYTLAQYKSPQYEELAFNIIKSRLIKLGYPPKTSDFVYDPSFPLRGLWFDRLYGTLLKYREELRSMYPNKFVKYDEKRIEIMNTLFSLPETYILSCIIHMFVNDPDYTKVEHGVKKGSLYMSYASIYEDVRTACDWMHRGELKQRTLANISEYVERDPRLCTLLDRLRVNGAKVFLLTNSDFEYSHAIMSYILGDPRPDGTIRKWTSYFDYIVTDARKPAFFQEGTILRVVCQDTGQPSIGHHMGPLETGQIYSGGSCEVFSNLIGARGKDVLYVGDHVYGDILKSKKTVGWRTYLIIPELANEIYVWKKKKSLFDELQKIDNNLETVYRDLNISSNIRPDVGDLQRKIRVSFSLCYIIVIITFDFYCISGSRHTFFSSQVLRYADLYSFSCINLIYYPLCYMFRAPAMLMPHESTVSHGDSPKDSFSDLDALPCGLRRRTRNEITPLSPDKNGLKSTLESSHYSSNNNSAICESDEEQDDSFDSD